MRLPPVKQSVHKKIVVMLVDESQRRVAPGTDALARKYIELEKKGSADRKDGWIRTNNFRNKFLQAIIKRWITNIYNGIVIDFPRGRV